MSADRYLRAGMHRIRGWLTPTDAMLLTILDEAHLACGVSGDLLEIGAFEGRTAILLGFLLRPGETLHVCDLFGAPDAGGPDATVHTTYYQGFSRQRFERNYRRFHEHLPSIHGVDSRQLGRRLQKSAFRVVHIDGSHQEAAVRQDLRTSRQFLMAEGFVVIDDWRTSHSPGVAAAFWGAVHVDGLIPVCATESKAFAVWAAGNSAREFKSILRERAVVEKHRVAGRELLYVHDMPGLTLATLRSRVASLLRRVGSRA